MYYYLHWNFEYTKAVTLHCARVGGGMDQGPLTQANHLRFNQPFSFCSIVLYNTMHLLMLGPQCAAFP